MFLEDRLHVLVTDSLLFFLDLTQGLFPPLTVYYKDLMSFLLKLFGRGQWVCRYRPSTVKDTIILAPGIMPFSFY